MLGPALGQRDQSVRDTSETLGGARQVRTHEGAVAVAVLRGGRSACDLATAKPCHNILCLPEQKWISTANPKHINETAAHRLMP